MTGIALGEVVDAVRRGARKADARWRESPYQEDLSAIRLPELNEVPCVEDLAPICIPDSEEARLVEDFIRGELARDDDALLLQVQERIRRDERCALGWYLRLLRECVGFHKKDDALTGLVLVPLIVRKGLGAARDLTLDAIALARSLEEALELEAHSLTLLPQAVPLELLERLKPLAWRALTASPLSEQAALQAAPFNTVGALLGYLRVPGKDKRRLSFRHGLERELPAWRSATEARLNTCSATEVRIWPPVLLYEFFTRIRQIELRSSLEEACREGSEGRRLSWKWNDASGELTWKLAGAQEEPREGKVSFPEEPRALALEHLARIARQLQLI